MSSIYDALQRIQGEKGTWSAPAAKGELPPGRRTIWLIFTAVVISSLCTAGVFYGIKALGEKKPAPLAASPTAAPGTRGGVPPQPKTVPAAQVNTGGAALPMPSVQAPSVPAPPETVDDYLKLGEQQYLAKDYEKAILTYTEAMHYFRKDTRLLNNIGSVYLAKGQAGKAVHYFKEARDSSRDSVEPVYNLACAYAAVGEKSKAISHLKLACSMNPQARKWAAQDPDLMDLKGIAEFNRIIGAQHGRRGNNE